MLKPFSSQDLSLPKSMIARLAKGVLPANTQIHKDALLALHKSATVFVNFIASKYVCTKAENADAQKVLVVTGLACPAQCGDLPHRKTSLKLLTCASVRMKTPTPAARRPSHRKMSSRRSRMLNSKTSYRDWRAS